MVAGTHFESCQSNAAWLAVFSKPDGPGGDPRTHLLGSAGSPVRPNERAFHLAKRPVSWSASSVETEQGRIVFDGLLYNRTELRSQLNDDWAAEPEDAELLWRGYQCWGESLMFRVKGRFALIIWDRLQDLLLCVRDPLGIHPLFYTDEGGTVLFSPSIETLIRYPNVSAELNRPLLVDHLARRWPRPEETYFAHVKRLPPGHLMRIDCKGSRVYRYWDPAPPGRPLQWIPDDEVEERFDALFDQIIDRYQRSGPVGVYVSGGIDSSALAMVTTDLCRRQGQAPPWALSLYYPWEDYDEAGAQLAVASGLNLQHVQFRFDEAVSPRGTLSAALDLSRTLPAPVSMIWSPAFQRLAVEGRGRGCKVLLTGDGADEWLGVNSILAADLLRSLDLRGFYKLWRTNARSYPFSAWSELRSLIWQFGLKALWNDLRTSIAEQTRSGSASSALKLLLRIRHTVRTARRSITSRRQRLVPAIPTRPPGLAPDPALRAQMQQRYEAAQSHDKSTPRRESFYLEDARSVLDLTQKWMLKEETFLLSRRIDLLVQQPFWDADLIELMIRIRPQVLVRGNLTKSFIRNALIRRFPESGFEHRRKSRTDRFWLSTVSAQAKPEYESIGGVRTLGELGVLDPAHADSFMNCQPRNDGYQWCRPAWDILNLEAWARAHYGSG